MFFDRTGFVVRSGGVLSACAVLGLFAGAAVGAPVDDDDKIEIIIKLDGKEGLHKMMGLGDGQVQKHLRQIMPGIMAGKIAGKLGRDGCDCSCAGGGARVQEKKMIIERLHGGGPQEGGPRKMQRHIEILGGPHGMGDGARIGGKVIIVGPDGQMHESDFGDVMGQWELEGPGERHQEHEIHIDTSGRWMDSSEMKDGLGGLKNLGIGGKVIIVGPDGVKREIDLGGGEPRSDAGVHAEEMVLGRWETDVPVFGANDEPPVPTKARIHLLTGDSETPFVVQPKGDHRTAQATLSMTLSIVDAEGNSYKIVIKGDDVSAFVNGKPVPADRIHRTKDSIEILDENGEVLNSFQTMGPGLRGFGQAQARRVEIAPRPRVRLGVTMSEPGNPLREHFGLDEEGGILIESVLEGLPASKAGLREYDIIVEINGQKPATQLGLRKHLGVQNPGDRLNLKIIRKGVLKDVVVDLEGYTGAWLAGGGEYNPLLIGKLRMDDLDGVHEDLENAFKNLKIEGEWFTDEDAREQFEQAMRHFEEKLSTGDFQEHLGNLGELGAFERFAPQDLVGGDEFVFSIPGNLKEQRQRAQQQIMKMEQKMMQLDARLERIDDMLKRLLDRGE